jgi:hypothetical protein
MERKIYDCFLYNGEIDALEIRLHELAEVVDRFVIIESDTSFTGLQKKLSFEPFEPRIAPFTTKIRYVPVGDMPQHEAPLRRESWQRNTILRGIPDARENDLILVSNVDEIPRAAAVREMLREEVSHIFGLELASYYFFVNYRNVLGPESATTWTIAARRAEFDKIAPHDLRHAVRHGSIPARILCGSGWHFSYLMDEAGIRRKIAALADQGFNNEAFLHSVDIQGIVLSRGDLFNRPGFRWDIVEATELPLWVQSNHRALSRLFCPRTGVRQFVRRLVPNFTRTFSAKSPAVMRPPVVICPYIHSHEANEISAKFGLKKPHGRKMEFFLWRDANGLGPERAFQHCWDQFPDRDIVIVHSDMAPMPDDRSNHWYDALLHYRNKFPHAGILGCNLFYPRATPEEPWRVQCAGGTYYQGQVGHMRGVVLKDTNAYTEGVPDAALRKVRNVDWVTFGGILIRREVIRACGPFDLRYRWAYVMDVDYCFEARLRGFRLFQVPVSLLHEESQTTRPIWEADPKLLDCMARNIDLFYEKWQPFSAALPSID